MAESKLCPHCGAKMFMATITRACVIEVSNDTTNPYTILKEGKDKFDIAILKCARCKETVTEADLVAAVACKECGKLVTPTEVDENGVCDVCNAMKQRTELANASKEDLVKMLLEAEKRSNPVAVKMEQKIEQVTTTATDVTIAETVEEVAIATEQEPKKRAKRRKHDGAVPEDKATQTVDTSTENADTSTEMVEATTKETTEIPVETETAVENLANQQEAPFPDMNLPEEMTAPAQEVAAPVGEEQPIGSDFRMFDDSDDAF